MAPLIIGITGPNAAGKGEVARHLETLGFTLHSLSDVVREEAAGQGFPPEREHLIRIGQQLRLAGGPGVLAERLLARIGGRDVIDSIRNPGEVEVLRRLRGFHLLGVNAATRTRFDRSLARARPGDPTTLAEFEARERQENDPRPQSQQLDATFRMADRVISNDSGLERLAQEIDLAIRDWASEAAPD